MKKLVLLSALVLVGCAKAPPPATLMTMEAADKQENNEKQIALEGYPRYPEWATVSDTMLIELHQDPSEKSKSINFDCPVGSGANHVEKPPKDFKAGDLKMYAADGTPISIKDKIRVEGQLTYWPDKDPKKHNVWLAAPITIKKL